MAKTYKSEDGKLKIVVTKIEGGIEYGKLVSASGEGPEKPVQSILWMMPYTDFEEDKSTGASVNPSPFRK